MWLKVIHNQKTFTFIIYTKQKMEKVIFEELKYGDKLYTIDKKGKVTPYTFLCYNPNFREKYAFLRIDLSGSHAEHFYKPVIEERMLKFASFKDAIVYGLKIEKEYLEKRLKEVQNEINKIKLQNTSSSPRS